MKPIVILFFLSIPGSLIAQVQLEVGVGVSQSGLNQFSPALSRLGEEAVVYMEGSGSARMAWQVAVAKNLGEKSRVRVGVEVMDGETYVRARDGSNFETLVLNDASYTKLGLPVDFQYQLMKWARITGGVGVNKYFQPKGESIYVWTQEPQDDIVEAVDFVRTFSVDYRYGVAFLPLKNVSVEVLFTGTLNQMNDGITYNGSTQNPNMKYRTAMVRLGYAFNLGD